MTIDCNFLSHLQIIHRDLATRNILVAEDGTLKISDFGFSRDISKNGRYRKLDGVRIFFLLLPLTLNIEYLGFHPFDQQLEI